MDVDLREYRPDESLRPFVQHFWTGRFDPKGAGPAAQRVVPSGFVEMIVHLTDQRCNLPVGATWRQAPPYTLIGLQHAPYEVRFGRAVEVFAICFKPAGFHALFGVPVREVVNTHEDVVSVLGGRFEAFAARIRDARDTAGRLRVAQRLLLDRAGRGRRGGHYVSRAEQVIWASGGSVRIEDVADDLAVSRRQLERAFKETLGVTPKQYGRVARLNRVLAMLQEGRYRTLAEIAYRAGYGDQAHFNRDFRLLVGDAPTLYLQEPDAYALNALDVGASAAAAEG